MSLVEETLWCKRSRMCVFRCWRDAEKWQAICTRPYTEGQSSLIACCSASDQASQGRRIIHFSRSEITDKLLGPTAPWNSVLARLARPLPR